MNLSTSINWFVQITMYPKQILIRLSLFSTLVVTSCKSTSSLTEKATIIVNGSYDLYDTKKELPVLMISYHKCPSVKEYFRLVSVGTEGYGALKPTKEQRECIAALKVSEQVDVVIESATNHLSGLKSWNTLQIQNCNVNGIDGGVRTQFITERKRCDWME